MLLLVLICRMALSKQHTISVLEAYEDIVKYSCLIGQHILDDPYQAECGHRYCKSCITQRLVVDPQLACPACIHEGSASAIITHSNIQPDYACCREMKSLHVRCERRLAGCNWSGNLMDLTAHLASCEMIPSAKLLPKNHGLQLLIYAQLELELMGIDRNIASLEETLSITGRHQKSRPVADVLVSMFLTGDITSRIERRRQYLHEQQAYLAFLRTTMIL